MGLRLLCVMMGLLFALTAGCGSREPHVVPLSKAENALSKVVMAYQRGENKLGRPPRDAEEIKSFLKDYGNPDELLVSPNDGQPYVVIWGARPDGGPTEYKGLRPILAYEKSGAGGRRVVVDVTGHPMTIPNEDFPKLKFAGRHKPAG